MGMLIDGQWSRQGIVDKSAGDGQFRRKESSFRQRITADGSSPFAPEAGRYHLYIAYACPWAHRAMIVRKLKNLEDAISYSVVHWFMGEDGWHFGDGPGVIPDSINQAAFLYQVYAAADPSYTGRVTVPVLWDKETRTIVNNESSEIIRMFNSAFDSSAKQSGADEPSADEPNADVRSTGKMGNPALDLYPEALRDEIDMLNDRIYNTVNNGVYKCGFACTQEAYNEAVTALFDTLDFLETRLAESRYIVGNQLTEADWRLFPTLVRFDPVYLGHFKCNIRRIADYPNLSNYLRELYQMPGIAETVNLEHIKNHYYQSHESINPTRIVPRGPTVDLMQPHNRG